MYTPTGFDGRLSMELGELICQAYEQFDAFEQERAWELSGDYSLKVELTYVLSAGRTLDRGRRTFDATLRRLAPSRKTRIVDIPIGFIAQRKNNVFLVFRGTRKVTEWIRNFDISLSPYLLPGYGRVHAGFLETYRLVRSSIAATLSAVGPRTRLYVAGHSLGGAIAVCSAPDIEITAKRRIEALYTFGSPRVGEDEFVQAFNRVFARRSFRIANSSDIVTSVPLPVPIAGLVGGYFSHVETPVDMTVQKGDLEANHDMRTYLDALAGIKTRKGIFNGFLAGTPPG
jgi:predicted lipase